METYGTALTSTQQAAHPVAAGLQYPTPGYCQAQDTSTTRSTLAEADVTRPHEHKQVSTPEGGLTRQWHAHEPLTPTSREWDPLSLRSQRF